jgi:hypothetical protein
MYENLEVCSDGRMSLYNVRVDECDGRGWVELVDDADAPRATSE